MLTGIRRLGFWVWTFWLLAVLTGLGVPGYGTGSALASDHQGKKPVQAEKASNHAKKRLPADKQVKHDPFSSRPALRSESVPAEGEESVRPDTTIAFHFPALPLQKLVPVLLRHNRLRLLLFPGGASADVMAVDTRTRHQPEGSMSWSEQEKTLVFTPKKPLQRYTAYTAQLILETGPLPIPGAAGNMPRSPGGRSSWRETPGRGRTEVVLGKTSFRTGSDLGEATAMELNWQDQPVKAGEIFSFSLSAVDDYGLPARVRLEVDVEEQGVRLPESLIVREDAVPGDFSCTLENHEAERVAVRLTALGDYPENTRHWDKIIEFVPADPARAEFVAETSSIPSGDGVRLDVTVYDGYDNAIPDLPVEFSAENLTAQFEPQSGVTGADGSLSTLLTAAPGSTVDPVVSSANGNWSYSLSQSGQPPLVLDADETQPFAITLTGGHVRGTKYINFPEAGRYRISWTVGPNGDMRMQPIFVADGFYRAFPWANRFEADLDIPQAGVYGMEHYANQSNSKLYWVLTITRP